MGRVATFTRRWGIVHYNGNLLEGAARSWPGGEGYDVEGELVRVDVGIVGVEFLASWLTSSIEYESGFA